MTVEIEPENRFQIQLLTDFGIYQSESRFGQPWKKLLILWLFFMPPKLVRTRNGFGKMQEYHLRLPFLLSNAETGLSIQIKEMQNLTSCYYVAPKSNIFVQYIPLVRQLFSCQIKSPRTSNLQSFSDSCNISVLAIFPCAYTNLALVCSWIDFKNDSEKRRKWNKASIFDRWTKVWILFVFSSKKVMHFVSCDIAHIISDLLKNDFDIILTYFFICRNEDRNQRLKERLQEKTTSFTENFKRRISSDNLMRSRALKRSGTFKNIGNMSMGRVRKSVVFSE